MKFNVVKNRIARLDSEMLTTKNVNSIECSFTFSDDYADLDLYAVFYRDENTNCFVELSDGQCILPHEMLEDGGTLCVGAYGVKNTSDTVEKRITTNCVKIQIYPSLSSSASPSAAPTPDMWEQYKQEILEYKAETEQYKNQAQAIKNSIEIDYDVQTNKVGFKKANESTYTYTGDLTGPKGEKGEQGEAGYTPVKGTDYWTDSDKLEMVDSVIAALPTWIGGSY